MSDRDTQGGRRRVLKKLGSLGALALAGCSGGGDGGGDGGDGDGGGGDGGDQGTPTPSMRTVHTLDAEGSASNVCYLYGVNNGAWEKYNIDLSVEVAAFGKFVRQIAAEISPIGSVAVPPAIDQVNQGEPLTFVGTQLTGVNDLLVRADSDIEDPTDLEGKRVGLPLESSAATRNFIALVLDKYDFDLRTDPAETTYQPPPVVYELLTQGEVDAIGEFTGLTIRGRASEDIRSIFSQNDYWQERTGELLPITNFVTKTSTLEEDPQLVYDFLRGWREAKQLLADNAAEAIQNYGLLAGLQTEGEAEIAKELTEQNVLFGDSTFLTESKIEAQWEYLNVMREAEQFDSLPDRDALFNTGSAIEGML